MTPEERARLERDVRLLETMTSNLQLARHAGPVAYAGLLAGFVFAGLGEPRMSNAMLVWSGAINLGRLAVWIVQDAVVKRMERRNDPRS